MTQNRSSENVNHTILENRKSRQFILLALLLIASAACIPIFAIFFVPLILATTFTVLFFPVYKKIRTLSNNNKSISSILCCIIFLLGLMVPLIILVHIVIHQMISFYTAASPMFQELLHEGSKSQIMQHLLQLKFFSWIQAYNINWQTLVHNSILYLTQLGTSLLNKTSSGIFGLLATLFITMFTMFYFFIDGEKIIQRLRFLSPVKSDYQDLILTRFVLISRATILGTVLIGCIQGGIGALTLLIFGVKSWILWGFVMVILAIIPLAGAWLVLIPAGIIKILLGHTWPGIGIILASVVVVSNIDNIIRPRIVGHGAKMHDLMIFFSTLGGLSLFGIMGFIVGPVIACFFITMVDIYELEFQSTCNPNNVNDKNNC
jgi:predicted PurR-regulated permease PerM